MFFRQVRRNAAKNRKGNGLFFGSLIVAIVAFYTLLSLGEQDVMHYLATIESDAVGKLLSLLPIVYAVSLFFVYFLVYFACKYQVESRRRELGMYLMLGMKQGRMFFMLFCETLWNSAAALLAGLPIALLLTEAISLATAKIAGLGIIGHRFSFSVSAILWTVCGFVFVQLLSMLGICIGIRKKEPAGFFAEDAVKGQRELTKAKSIGFFVTGAAFLLAAYYLGMFRMQGLSFYVMAAVVFFGISGTFLLYRGLGGLLGISIRKKRGDALGLTTFTARQVQENVIAQHKSLAISNLLITMALACISYGVAMGVEHNVSSRSVDFSIFGEEAQAKSVLQNKAVREMTGDSYPLYLSMVKEQYMSGGNKEFDLTGLADALRTAEGSKDLVENMIENLHLEYVIAQSSYNRILKGMGKKELDLTKSGNKVALYSSIANEGEFGQILEDALQGAGNGAASIGIDGAEYEISSLCIDNVVADRSITLYLALVVPDELWKKLADEPEPYCVNMRLRNDLVEEMGLMQAVQKMDARLSEMGIEYDSYLGGIGRNLFYTVAASYLTIYLGVLFWLIANTVIGLKYLIAQCQTKHRYETLTMLGADMGAMCESVKKQIGIYFRFVIILALASGGAAIYTMFTSFTKLPVGASVFTVALLCAAALLIFLILEKIYITLAVRAACREIRQL